MKSISFTHLQFNKPTTLRSERDELIQKFLDRINPGRERAGYKPYTAKVLLGRIARAKIDTSAPSLYALYNQCDKADSFSKLFEWKMKGGDNRGSA